MEQEEKQNSSISKEQFQAMSSQLVGRMNLALRLGQQFSGDRNLYDALGYKRELSFQDYYTQYKRQDIAKAIIDRPVNKTWEGDLTLLESSDEEETQLERQWKELVKKLGLKNKFARLDKLTGLGRYGILLLGLNDIQKKEDWQNPVQGSNKKLLYVKPISENHVSIEKFENKASNERYGLPTIYNITVANPETKSESELRVHHSRVLHVTDDCLMNELEGTPRLEAVYNRLYDLEKLVGGSAEMFWRGARPGYSGKLDKDHQFTEQDDEKLKEQMDEFDHNLRRTMIQQGLEMKELAPQVADPQNHVDVQIQMISAEKGIPKRILVGSERGELASSEDKNQWFSFIQGRREEFAESQIIRPFIDRCQQYGILPEAAEEYEVQWQDLFAPSTKEKVDVGKVRAEALKQYAAEPMSQGVVPPEAFLKLFLGLSEEEAELVKEMMEQQMVEQEEVTEEEEDQIQQEQQEE